MNTYFNPRFMRVVQAKACVAMAVSVLLSACTGNVVKQNDSLFSVPDEDYHAVTQSGQTMYHYLLGHLAGVHSATADRAQDEPQAREYSGMAATHLAEAADRLHEGALSEYAARAAFYANDDKKSKEISQQWLQLEPRNPRSHEFAAMVALKSKKTSSAVVYFKQMIALMGDVKLGLMKVAGLCGTKEYQPTGEQVMRNLSQNYANHPYSYFAYSQVLYGNGKKQQALGEINRMLAIAPNIKQAQVLKASIQAELGQSQAALKSLEALAKMHPDDSFIRNSYANQLIEQQHFTKAHEQLTQLNQLPKKDPRLSYKLAMVSLALGYHVETEQHIQSMLMKNSDPQTALYYKALLDIARLNFNRAYQTLNQITEASLLRDAQYRQAKLLGLMKGEAAGIEFLNKMQSSDAGKVERIRWAMAKMDIQYDNGQYQAAYDEANRLLKKYPDNTDILYMRSLMAEKAGNVNQGISDLESILKQKPNDADIQNALGYSLMVHDRQLPRAEKLIKKAYQQRPDSAAVIDSLGWLKFKQGKLSQAKGLLSRAYRMQKEPEIASHYAQVLFALNQSSKAKKILKTIHRAFPRHVLLKQVMQKYGVQ